MFKEVDISVMKSVALKGRTRAEFRIEMLNAFNTVNFVPNSGVGSTTIGGYERSANGGLTGTNTSRLVQLVTRFTW